MLKLLEIKLCALYALSKNCGMLKVKDVCPWKFLFGWYVLIPDKKNRIRSPNRHYIGMSRQEQLACC